jgi:light-regulated signal transduction histidine kinase (bacteriophytochrome)
MNHDLAAVNRELESFSYSVSHDLRAPLRAIDGFSQVLLEDFSDNIGGKGVEYLQRVRAGAQKMAILIDDILNLSRVSRCEMNIVNLNLSELVGIIVQEHQEADAQRSVDVRIQPELKVAADAALLRIMLQNLIDNAWKFTSKMQAAKIEFGIMRLDNKAAFYLRDNGVGFDMAYADKLFVPFQRFHPVGEYPGTGIGLATVYRVVKRHGGQIWADSAPGQGTTFFFRMES